MLCGCGSREFVYMGIDEVEGNIIIEAYKCVYCGTYVAKETYVPTDDDDDESDFVDLDEVSGGRH